MKINKLSQNNPAFGVRIPIKEATISKLRDQIPKNKNHQLAKPVDGSILGIIYDKIINTKRKDSSLISFFQDIASKNEKLRNFLEQSGKTLERAFWETCDKFFDVQLVANDKDKNIDNITDDKIKEDDYLTRIFHPIKNIEEKRKQIIEYCIKNYSKAKKNRKKFCEEVKKKLNLDMEAKSIRDSILGPIIKLPGHYNAFKKNAIQGKEQTFTEFKEYLIKKATPSDNRNFYNSGNGELLTYTIETFKKYVPEFKEEFVFAEDTIANTNTVGKEKKKRTTPEQTFDDAVYFIDYYIGENIINLNLTSKEMHSILFKTNKNHVSLGALNSWRIALNKIKETLEKYPNKKNEDIMNDIKNEYHSNKHCILTDKKLFSRAINKLRALNKTTNDNIVEASDNDSDYIDSDTLQTKINTRASIKRMHEPNIAKKTKINDTSNTDIGNRNRTKNSKLASYIDSDSNYSDSDYIDSDYIDSDYIDSDTLQANINTQASIKRMHVTMPLDIDKTYSKDDSLKENECEVFNTKDTQDGINMFETKRQHLFPNQGAPILPNLNNKTVIPMPQAMDNFENEKRPNFNEQLPLVDKNNEINNFGINYDDGLLYESPFAKYNHSPVQINYDSPSKYNDSNIINEHDSWQNNDDKSPIFISYGNVTFNENPLGDDNVSLFTNNYDFQADSIAFYEKNGWLNNDDVSNQFTEHTDGLFCLNSFDKYNHPIATLNYDSKVNDKDSNIINENDSWQNNFNEARPLISPEDGTFHTSFLDNAPFINTNSTNDNINNFNENEDIYAPLFYFK